MPSVYVSSWSLAVRAAAGDPANRERFATRYDPVVRSYFAARWRLPADDEDVRDAAQDVFLQCFKDGSVLAHADASRGTDFRAYLYGVARRVGSGIERRSARRRQLQSRAQLEAIQRSEATLSRAYDRAWARLVVREAGELARRRTADDSPRARGLLALQLRIADDMPPRKIAERFGLDVTTVYELLRRAKDDFRAAFLEVMAAYNPSATEAELKHKCVELVASL